LQFGCWFVGLQQQETRMLMQPPSEEEEEEEEEEENQWRPQQISVTRQPPSPH